MSGKGARRPSPPQSSAQRQRELARMLVRMDEMLKSTSEMAARTRSRVSVGGLNRYRRFAKRVRDFFALAGVAEEKLYNLPELADSPIATALDRMHARMVVMFVEGSWGFFDLYRRVPELPLGANEICGVELRGLYEIRKFLDDERYDGERGQALRRQAERVTDAMLEIMERAPPLEDFGDLPSISPKGVTRQPIKVAPKRRTAPPPVEPAPLYPEPYPEPEPAFAPAAWSGAVPAAAWSVMTPDDLAPENPAEPYEAAGGAWPPTATYQADSYEAEAYDDSAYVDDVPDDVEDDETVIPPQPVGPDGGGADGGRPSPSSLVRELTLDMVEAEERRAALAERLAASRGQGASAEPSSSARSSSGASFSPPPAAAPPAAASPAASPARSAAAPFRAPPAIRPIKRT